MNDFHDLGHLDFTVPKLDGLLVLDSIGVLYCTEEASGHFHSLGLSCQVDYRLSSFWRFLSISHLESAGGMTYATSWLQHGKGQGAQVFIYQKLPGGGEQGHGDN